MSYAKGTTHYNLPQTMGDDKRDWFDTNEPFAAVDAALNGAVEEVAVLDKDVTTLKSDMETAKTDIVGLKAYDTQNDVKVSALQTLTAQHTVDIENVRQDSEDMICAIEEGSATASYAHEIGSYFRYNDTLYITTVPINVGDTIVPDVNCSTTDIVTRLGNADEVSRLKTKVDEVETQVDEVETQVGRVETQVGDKDISSYGASVTDAIANSNVKVLDGELYKLSDGTWSPYNESVIVDISPGSSDYFTATKYKLTKVGALYMIEIEFTLKQAVKTSNYIGWYNWEGFEGFVSADRIPIFASDLNRLSLSSVNIWNDGTFNIEFAEDHSAGSAFRFKGICYKEA